MSILAVVGGQWGDEGKGKIVDLLARDFDVIVRCQGGNNAGHTVKVGEARYPLHLLPSGILRQEKLCVIGNGVVLDLATLLREIDGLAGKGIAVSGKLAISDRCHLVLPWHVAVDQARGSRLGTTGRGIGPAYEDKVGRTGLRVGQLYQDAELRAALEQIHQVKSAVAAALELPSFVSVDELFATLLDQRERIREFVTDTALLLNRKIAEGTRLLFEGAQGAMLDIDHGTYPFVTSSNATVGGVCTGSGVGPAHLDRVLGIFKAYTTRVGQGPMPTELTDATGERMRQRGQEFGTTTGRPRRCGWFDGVAARYSVMVNGITEVALTKLDVLSQFPEIQLCTGYELDGTLLESFPADLTTLERCRPRYETLPGWQQDLEDVRTLDDLPLAALRYVDRLAALLQAPVRLVSVGPEREETIRIPAA